MKKIFALISLVVMTMTATAQLSVVEDSFKLRPNDITAIRERRIDDNNTECSLLKIKTLNITEEERKQFEFRGDALTQFVDRRFPTGEIWVWLTPEASFIEFRYPKYSTCKYIFPITKMEPLKVYDLTLKAEWNDGPGQKKPTVNYLIVMAEPKEAMIYVNDGQHEYSGNGEMSKSFPVGTTVSWRIECNMYHPESGKVTINSGEPVSVDKKLVPAFGYLSIDSKPESGAKVSIDGNLVGETPYRSDRLASGTHKVTLRKDMYKTTEQTVTVTDGNTATVIVNMPANFADITLTTDAESDIYIDNQYKGKGRWSGRLIAGTYLAEARKASHSTKFKTLNIVEGKNETIKIDDPTPIYGMLDVNTSPTGATIYIDGKNCSTTPRILSEVLIGKHTLRLEKAGCAPVTKEINIEKDEMLSVNEKLPEGKSITITSEPSGASVYVDGNYFGTTPVTKELGFGRHTVKVVNGKMEKQQNIEVTEKGRTDYHFDVVNGKEVKIVSSESRADIFIDGKKVGTGTVSQKLEYGQHKIRAEYNGRVSTESVNFTASSSDRINLNNLTYPRLTFVMLHAVALDKEGDLLFGVTYGNVKKIGFFVSAMSNFNMQAFNAELTATGDNGEMDGVVPYYDGTTALSRLSVTAGMLIRLSKPACLKLGVGYGSNVLSARTLGGKLVKQAACSYTGLDLTAGITFCFGHFAFDFEMLSTNFQTLEGGVGIGYVF